jgi:hypothetical protein
VQQQLQPNPETIALLSLLREPALGRFQQVLPQSPISLLVVAVAVRVDFAALHMAPAVEVAQYVPDLLQ